MPEPIPLATHLVVEKSEEATNAGGLGLIPLATHVVVEGLEEAINAGVPEFIPLAAHVREQYEVLMWKVHALIEARKLREGEEQEMQIRESEGS